MSAEAYASLQAEIAALEGPARVAIAEEIKTARGFGDLKENAEYHEAKNAQARLETKILQLRQRLMDAEVVEVTHGGDRRLRLDRRGRGRGQRQALDLHAGGRPRGRRRRGQAVGPVADGGRARRAQAG